MTTTAKCPAMQEIEDVRDTLVELIVENSQDMAHSWLGTIERALADATQRGEDTRVKALLTLHQALLEQLSNQAATHAPESLRRIA